MSQQCQWIVQTINEQFFKLCIYSSTFDSHIFPLNCFKAKIMPYLYLYFVTPSGRYGEGNSYIVYTWTHNICAISGHVKYTII